MYEELVRLRKENPKAQAAIRKSLKSDMGILSDLPPERVMP